LVHSDEFEAVDVLTMDGSENESGATFGVMASGYALNALPSETPFHPSQPEAGA
jgi:hypothetical protein